MTRTISFVFHNSSYIFLFLRRPSNGWTRIGKKAKLFTKVIQNVCCTSCTKYSSLEMVSLSSTFKKRSVLIILGSESSTEVLVPTHYAKLQKTNTNFNFWRCRQVRTWAQLLGGDLSKQGNFGTELTVTRFVNSTIVYPFLGTAG